MPLPLADALAMAAGYMGTALDPKGLGALGAITTNAIASKLQYDLLNKILGNKVSDLAKGVIAASPMLMPDHAVGLQSLLSGGVGGLVNDTAKAVSNTASTVSGAANTAAGVAPSLAGNVLNLPFLLGLL